MAATRPVISYDDITLPYDQPMDGTISSSTRPPPSKKRKRNNKSTQPRQKTQQHWDDPNHASGSSEHIAFSTSVSFSKEEETNEEEFGRYEESRELSHEEIWDDSALIEAWDAATEEYEAYNGPDKGWKKEPVHQSPL